MCGVCNKKFQIEANLENRLKNSLLLVTHVRPVEKCSFDKISLGDHMNMRNGALPYNCSFCNKVFG